MMLAIFLTQLVTLALLGVLAWPLLRRRFVRPVVSSNPLLDLAKRLNEPGARPGRQAIRERIALVKEVLANRERLRQEGK